MQMNLIIDIGNTKVKLAIFDNKKLIEKTETDYTKAKKEIKKFLKKYDLKNVIVSSVTKYDINQILEPLNNFKKIIELNNKTNVPFKNKYSSPETLGTDRLALAASAASKYPNENVLVIDAGTCITYDFLNENNEYLGGSISPGLSMRYKALSKYTSNLPLLEKHDFQLIGHTTQSSIHSGVINGLLLEIDGVINQYSSHFQNLTVVLTGGDTIFLAKMLKSTIFANPNFLLEGLNSIMIHNLDE
jgi:type III pantothenate kinase